MVIKANQVIMSDKSVVINPGTALEKEIVPPRYGSLILTYQDGRLIQVERSEKHKVV
ncbi:YezD family protein [Fodinisporobacter ferrooxydans]|uniref:YezD family protein n=1 Tax=Fodinisporobacter ferrooxydans TaxID=2901836 RepID=A0ABY4CKK2_9BACL|nr:YezD family protein [Alicyclobacillaceae bacterium MYW30-H2]